MHVRRTRVLGGGGTGECDRADRPAGFIASLAGRAAGAIARRTRRGSVLVLILGAIAMLAVVTVAYVTVGATDRRTGSSVVARDRVQDTIGAISEYIARDIIGRDALAVYTDGVDPQVPGIGGALGPVLVREAHDAPSADPFLVTNFGPSTAAPGYRRFNPAGTYDEVDPVVAGGANPPPDPRFPTDPWLSSSEPAWLEGDTLTPAPLPEEVYRLKRDWAVISNIGPSGNPVNLYNLRNNFDAQPGCSANALNPAANSGKMSDRLSLFDSAGLATNTTWYGLNLNAAPGGQPPHWLRPFHWTTHQYGAFRPMNDVNYGPEDPQYLAYQWADADGDGMLDSRWFELVDVSDPRNPVSVLPRDDRYRWFVAARIIDLSGLVNINAAVEFRAPPGTSTFMGTTPADIDLRRILRMVDPYEQWNSPAGNVVGYEGLEQPGPYAGYNRQAALAIGDWSNYALRIAVRDGSVPYPGADLVNDYSFNGGIANPLPALLRSTIYLRGGAHPLSAAFTADPAASGVPARVTAGLFGLPDLLELLTYWGVNDPATVSRLELALGGRYSPINGSGAPVDELRSPLRDNRSLAHERGGHDNQLANGAPGRDGQPDEDALFLAAFDVRRLLTTFSQSRLLRSSILLPFLPNTPDFRQRLEPAGDQKFDAEYAFRAATADPDPEKRDPSLLFAAYAEALLPHSWRRDPFNPNVGVWTRSTLPQYGPLFYGDDPVLALWCAAHLTANAIDMYDRPPISGNAQQEGRDISAFTLALSGHGADLDTIDQNSGPSGGVTGPLYPYWKTRGSGDRAGTLDLDRALGLRDQNQGPTQTHPYPSRMARQNDLPGLPRAMNIFGIEAQPFITQVATFTFFTDAPEFAGGDDEYQPIGPPPGVPSTPITIDGSMTQSNSDYIGQVLAFQLTNPFDVSIDLTGTTTTPDYSEFYIEFGGELYRLADADNGGAQVTLSSRPGAGGPRTNSRVFYVLNDSMANMEARFAARTTPPAPPTSGLFREMVEKQLTMAFGGNTVQPIRIQRMDRLTGTPIVSGFINDVLSTTTPEQNNVVKLWRRAKTSQPPADLWDDDILVDRLHDPSGGAGQNGVLARRPPSGNNLVAGTLAGPEPSSLPSAAAFDNTGFSICYLGMVKRPDDTSPATGATRIPIGAIPAYCMEAHPATGAVLNHHEPPAGGNVTPFDRADFTSNGIGHVGSTALYHPTVPSLQGDMKANARIPSLAEFPEDKLPDPAHPGTPGHHERYPEIYLNNDEFRGGGSGTRSVLRAGDMLLPLCVGPSRVPDPAIPADEQWLTLGESLALALGYADVPSTHAGYGFLSGLGDLATTPVTNKTDRGNLLLDRFIPYEELGGPTPNRYDAGFDERRAPGVPLGATVLDVFKATPADLSSIQRGVQGLVNINTAPARVLKALPLLCPSPTNVPADYWGQGNPALPQPPRQGITTGSDYAATIEAYRDTSRAMAVDGRHVTFQSTVQTLEDSTTWNGRASTLSNQPSPALPLALREAPGLVSIGEVFLAREDPAVSPDRVPREHGINDLASDSSNSGAVGVTTAIYGANASFNEIDDDYAEQLMVAKGLGGVATVRSDTFACWMIIHGYQRSDCENLSNTAGSADPLVPTIAKRYLMVVDRSNVTRIGDKPRILLMQEVPF